MRPGYNHPGRCRGSMARRVARGALTRKTAQRRQHMSMLDITMALGVVVLVVLIILRKKGKG